MIGIIRNYTSSALRQSVANRPVDPSEKPSGADSNLTRAFVTRPRYPQGWVTHCFCSWHDLRHPHSAKHTPSPAAASKASTHGQQNSSTTSGALYIGAFVGMPRSAAYNGVVARVKANRAADPTAVMRRNIANPPFESSHSTVPIIFREGALDQFTEQFR